MNTRIVSSHTVHLMHYLKQMMTQFVERELHLTGQNRCDEVGHVLKDRRMRSTCAHA